MARIGCNVKTGLTLHGFSKTKEKGILILLMLSLIAAEKSQEKVMRRDALQHSPPNQGAYSHEAEYGDTPPYLSLSPDADPSGYSGALDPSTVGVPVANSGFQRPEGSNAIGERSVSIDLQQKEVSNVRGMQQLAHADSDYLATFVATGCPNIDLGNSEHHTASYYTSLTRLLERWKSDTDEDVLDDMYFHCTTTDHFRQQVCCGTLCPPTHCTRQSRILKFHTDAAYAATFSKVGCPNLDIRVGSYGESYWKRQGDHTALNDMLAYCTLTKDGHANSQQQALCCGSTTEQCTPASCTAQSEITEARLAQYQQTFIKTGCPGSSTPTTYQWWMSKSDSYVLADMQSYCTLNKNGQANSWQQTVCCGAAPGRCPPTSCTQQSKILTGNSDAEFVATFNEVGCPNQNLPQTQLDYWANKQTQISMGSDQSGWGVLTDMFHFCVMAKHGWSNMHSTESRQEMCCGTATEDCPLSCTPLSRFVTACASTRDCPLSYTCIGGYCQEPTLNDVVATFSATGCPNNNADVLQQWLMKARIHKVLEVTSKMLEYCTLTQDGQATQEQERICCGETTGQCLSTGCTQQSEIQKAGPQYPYPNDEHHHCVRKRLCMNTLTASQRGDVDFMCKCVEQGHVMSIGGQLQHWTQYNGTLCKPWIECLYNHRSETQVVMTALLMTMAVQNGDALIEEAPRASTTLTACFNPANKTQQKYLLKCECLPSLVGACGNPLVQMDAKQCLRDMACCHPGVCPDWQDDPKHCPQGCNSTVFAPPFDWNGWSVQEAESLAQWKKVAKMSLVSHDGEEDKKGRDSDDGPQAEQEETRKDDMAHQNKSTKSPDNHASLIEVKAQYKQKSLMRRQKATTKTKTQDRSRLIMQRERATTETKTEEGARLDSATMDKCAR